MKLGEFVFHKDYGFCAFGGFVDETASSGAMIIGYSLKEQPGLRQRIVNSEDVVRIIVSSEVETYSRLLRGAKE